MARMVECVVDLQQACRLLWPFVLQRSFRSREMLSHMYKTPLSTI